MPKLLLTDISIRALKSETRVDYWDTKTPGFGIRVGPRGKTFILKQGGTRRTVGSYPAVGLQEARKQAFILKGKGAPTASSKITFEAAYEKFKVEHIARKKERTQRDYQRVLDRYLVPEFTGTLLVKITYEAITEITDELADTPSEQAHVLAVARTFFKWCARPPRRYIPHSPLEGLQLHVGKKSQARPHRRRASAGLASRGSPRLSAWHCYSTPHPQWAAQVGNRLIVAALDRRESAHHHAARGDL